MYKILEILAINVTGTYFPIYCYITISFYLKKD